MTTILLWLLQEAGHLRDLEAARTKQRDLVAASRHRLLNFMLVAVAARTRLGAQLPTLFPIENCLSNTHPHWLDIARTCLRFCGFPCPGPGKLQHFCLVKLGIVAPERSTQLSCSRLLMACPTDSSKTWRSLLLLLVDLRSPWP